MSGGKRGVFISVEGGDGAGKTTQIKALEELLTAEGYAVTVTREPGGCDNAEELRKVLLSKPDTPWKPWTEAFLIAAARHEHVTTIISPALSNGGAVISDRYSDSTLAYQGYGRGLPLADLQMVIEQAEQGVRPDLVIVLDLDPRVAAGRLAARGEAITVFESQGNDFQARVRQAYLDLAAEEPNRYAVIDAEQSAEAVTEAIKARVKQMLEARS